MMTKVAVKLNISFTLCLMFLSLALFSYSLYAEESEIANPIGCVDADYKYRLKTLNLLPEANTQTMYFFYNLRTEPITLYQMLGEESTRSMFINHTIEPNKWAVLAVSEQNMRFICTIPNNEDDFGNVVDCRDSVKVCHDKDVRFGLNNKGNFWLVGSNSKNGALRQVVYYGIIP